MITTSAPPRRSRIFEVALVLSLLVHLLVVLVYFGVFARIVPLIHVPEKDEQPAAVSDVVRLERRTVPRPQVQARVPVPQPVRQPPRPQLAVRQAPPVVVKRPVAVPKPHVERELALVAPRAPAQPKPGPTVPAVQAPKQFSQRAAAPQSGTQSATQDLEAAQQQRYLNAIAQGKSDLENIPPTHQVSSAIRRLNANMLGSTISDLQHAQGIVERADPCDRCTPHCYFVRARIIYQDGFVELVDVPWPFIFSGVRVDPIQMANGRYFVPPPPPDGYRLPHPFAPSRFVCTYFRDDCKALFAAEEAAGGVASGSGSN